MRHMLIVLGICIGAIVVGAGLYLYGPAELREVPPVENAGASVVQSENVANVPFTVLAQGERAVDMTERKNVAVYDAAEFERLWTMVYGEEAPTLPSVDFDSMYVIGVFAGEQPSGGHAIDVAAISDQGASRMVTVTRTSPGADCITTEALTSPFQLVTVPFSGKELMSVEELVVAACS